MGEEGHGRIPPSLEYEALLAYDPNLRDRPLEETAPKRPSPISRALSIRSSVRRIGRTWPWRCFPICATTFAIGQRWRRSGATRSRWRSSRSPRCLRMRACCVGRDAPSKLSATSSRRCWMPWKRADTLAGRLDSVPPRKRRPAPARKRDRAGSVGRRLPRRGRYRGHPGAGPPANRVD